MDSQTSSRRGDRAIAAWLLACCALVFAMVVVGGMTRLTHSGLSIVEWQPIVGAIPPLNDVQWEEAFAKYRATPEFRLRNHDMALAGFKGIFWWEYFHRLLGRVIGAVFLVPFVYFLARGRIGRRLAWPLAGIFVLGALQGALGWYMVKSGLVDDPRVSSVRLAAHLGLAFLIYAAMLWVALGLLHVREAGFDPRAKSVTRALAGLVFVMVLSGALVAGIRAGYAYNTFPLMNGDWIPPEVLMIEPWWMNFVHNMATVQLVHRALALAVALGVAFTWWTVRSRTAAGTRARRWANALALFAVIQIAVGIATLVLRVPLALAALHQAGALIVFTCAISLAHTVRGVARLQR
ncbi:MAG TPA: COX15/CtaA family protein [Usitatibacter sp.]|nr:COX15/CtaA family protein [Usitatibacter sp.]